MPMLNTVYISSTGTLPYTLARLRAMEAALAQFSERGPEQARMAANDLHRAANSRKAFAGQHQGLLDPAILARVGFSPMLAQVVVEGFLNGLHKSPFHGFSVEFADHREYVAGDDLKYLDWALYGWSNSPLRAGDGYYETVARLVRAGAKLAPERYEDIENRRSAVEKVRSDARMQAALRGEIPG